MENLIGICSAITVYSLIITYKYLTYGRSSRRESEVRSKLVKFGNFLLEDRRNRENGNPGVTDADLFNFKSSEDSK